MISSAHSDPVNIPVEDGRKNMMLLLQLRWIAVFGQIVTIAVIHFFLGINLPVLLLLAAPVSLLLVILVTRITRNLRDVDARLAAMKQHMAEEDLIIRMGWLASNSAHELGTPLSSISVILNDWRRMPDFAARPEIVQEIEDMQAAVQRCKGIVTNILLSAGEARSESPQITTVNTFLNDLVGAWHSSCPSAVLSYQNKIDGDTSIVSDPVLQQVIFNVLDNALEVSPDFIELKAAQRDGTLFLSIADKGPGFSPDILARFGKPYQSTKARAGAGLGLFLVVNVLRHLGGSVSVENRPEGGAVVTMGLPLSILTVGDRTHAT